jgi:hypothetical protein
MEKETKPKSQGYVVSDYSFVGEADTEPIVSFIPEDALLEVMDDAHKKGKKITISPVGAPVVDWRT